MQWAVGLSLVFLGSSLLGGAADAASFDCKKAQLPAERTICGNANLSRLDEQMAGLYFLIVGSGGQTSIIATVKTTQNAFLKSRNACGSQPGCLVDAYTSRMMLLKNVKDDLGL